MKLCDAVNEHQLQGLPLVQIQFTYKDKDLINNYWNKPWIKACTISQQKIFTKKVYIDIDEDVLNINSFSKRRWGFNFNTDPLRLIFTCLFGNAVYVDSDVFIEDTERIKKDLDKYNAFVYDGCSGNFFYCRYKNFENVLKWIDWYDNLSNDYPTGDVEAYIKKGWETVRCLDRPFGLVHMAVTYLYYHQKRTIQILKCQDVPEKSALYAATGDDHLLLPLSVYEPMISYLEAKEGILEFIENKEQLDSTKPALIFRQHDK